MKSDKLDSFSFESELFHEETNLVKRPRIITSSSSPRVKKPNLTAEARDLFFILHNSSTCEQEFDRIGELQTYLHSNLRLEKRKEYSQNTALGRWLQFIQFLFTTYTNLSKNYSRRQLRQEMIQAILTEFQNAEVQRY